MNLYEIDKSISEILEFGFDESCIDESTGEVLFELADSRLSALEVEETTKLENIALFIKNTLADVDALKLEEKALAERRKQKENKVDWLKRYITDYMLASCKTKFETARCALSFRKSEYLDIENEEAVRAYAATAGLLKFKDPEVDKAGIKKAIKDGATVPGARIAERQNLQIK